MINVLMVCLGNICRSPMAEAVMTHLVSEAGYDALIKVESAGTGRWHEGEPPHQGTLAELRRRGLSLPGKRAMHTGALDIAAYDYIVVMDHDNLRAMGGAGRLLLSYAADVPEDEVPDPYYTGGFGEVYDLVESGCRALLAHIEQEHSLSGRPLPGRDVADSGQV